MVGRVVMVGTVTRERELLTLLRGLVISSLLTALNFQANDLPLVICCP